MVSFTDFDNFPPYEYLREYYADVGEENSFLLDFFSTALQDMRFKTAADVGSGPTIYQLISIARKADNIHIYEYNSTNRQEMKKWIQTEPDAFDWSPFFDFVAKLEQQPKDELVIAVKDKVKEFRPLNLLNPDFDAPETYEMAGSHFCAESITSNKDEFGLAIRNLVKFLKPGGFLMMSLLKNAVSYRAGSFKFPAYPVRETDIEKTLEKENITVTRLESIEASEGRDYGGIICLTGRKH